MEPRLFVSIAAYRDPDCRATLASLFGKADHPERIVVGLCWQALPSIDDDRYPVHERADQIRVITVDARDSLGVCWARHRVQSLWQGEDYMLQIDSHMRFVAHWDTLLLAMIAQCPAERPVLSTYPAGFIPPDTIEGDIITTMHAVSFDGNGILRLDSLGSDPAAAPSSPQPNPFCAGGFLFAAGAVIDAVPYDPHLYFHGEEITLAARLWTHGWDVYSPNAVIVYHDYGNHPGRQRHWNDNQNWNALDSRAHKRVRHLLGIEPSRDPAVIEEIERYGLGTARSLASFETFAGVDFARRLVNGKTSEEIEASAPPDTLRRKATAVFTDIWRNNGWGNPETRSGPGSTVSATAILRPKLAELFVFLGITALADAGCGDLNWIADVTGSLRFYFGLDVVEDMLAGLRVRFRDRPSHFFAFGDISVDPLPAADAILCRDVLTHLPNYAVSAALRNVKASGARYLIASTHPGAPNATIPLGGWRPLDPSGPPFNLPRPRILLQEGSGEGAKALGVWHCDVLPGL